MTAPFKPSKQWPQLWTPSIAVPQAGLVWDASGEQADASPVSTLRNRQGYRDVGTDVSKFPDLTGTSSTRPTVTSAYFRGHAALQTDANDDYLKRASFNGGALAQPLTQYVVGVVGNKATAYMLDGGGSSNRHQVIFYADGHVDLAAGATLSSPVDSYAYGNPDQAQLFEFVANGERSFIRQAGVTIAGGNAGTDGLDGLTIGMPQSVGSYPMNLKWARHLLVQGQETDWRAAAYLRALLGETYGVPVKPTIGYGSIGDSHMRGSGTHGTAAYQGGTRLYLFENVIAAGFAIECLGDRVFGPIVGQEIGGRILRDRRTQAAASDGTVFLGDVDNAMLAYCAKWKPSVIHLQCGTNDMTDDTKAAAAPAVLEAILEKALRDDPDRRVIVCSCPHIYGSNAPPNYYSDWNDNTIAYNSAAEDIVDDWAAKGWDVRWVDTYSSSSQGNLYDGIHFNQAQHDTWGAQILPHVIAPY